MKSKLRTLFSVILICCLRCTAQETPAGTSKTFFVAPDGDDSGLGTVNLPFKTIGHAIQTALPGDTVLLRSGTYRESLVINNSGTASKPRILQASATSQFETGTTLTTALA